MYITFCLSIHPLMNEHSPFGLVNSASVNTNIQISVRVPSFKSFGHIPRSKVWNLEYYAELPLNSRLHN